MQWVSYFLEKRFPRFISPKQSQRYKFKRVKVQAHMEQRKQTEKVSTYYKQGVTVNPGTLGD